MFILLVLINKQYKKIIVCVNKKEIIYDFKLKIKSSKLSNANKD